MTPAEIRDTVLKAIYSDPDLTENLVLKGGNALRFHNMITRESQDLDFSIRETIRFSKENEGRKLEQLITESFKEKGFFVNDFEFIDKPKIRHENLKPFWGGYQVSFTILELEKYGEKIQEYTDNLKELNKYAMSLENGSKKIEIDLSYDEYIEQRETYSIDGTTIYLYSPLMIVYEKIRASCQQLDDYPYTTNSKVRARDLFDIFKSLTNPKYMDLRSEVLDEKNFDILENIFRVKDVSFDLMLKLDSKKDKLKEDYTNKVLPQIQSQDWEDFEYIFDYNKTLFTDLFYKYQKCSSK